MRRRQALRRAWVVDALCSPDVSLTSSRTEADDDPLSGPTESALGAEVVRPFWAELDAEMMRRLDAMTVATLRRKGLRVLRSIRAV